MSSACAVSVTVWAVFQFVDVNVSVFWRPTAASVSTVTAAVLALVRVAVTVWVGCDVSRTVYSFAASEAWSSVSNSGPASSVAGELGSASNMKPGAWASVVFAVIVACRFVYSLVDAVLAAWVMVTFSPTPSVSWAAVRVTVWGVFQLALVKVRVFCTPGSACVSFTVTAVVSPLVMVTVTSWVGSDDSRTV